MGFRALGLDIGTSAVKGVVFECAPGEPPRPLARASRPQTLEVPHPGWAEQDPDRTLALVEQVLQELEPWIPSLRAVGLSGAMHSLLPVDEALRPLGRAITWADGRAAEQALRLRRSQPGLADRTGTPLHPMAWPAKLMWLREHQPEIFSRARYFLGIKEYILARWGLWPPCMDASMASGTGLYDIHREQWDPALVESLSAGGERLPVVVATTSRHSTGRLPVPLAPGGGDGPLSNLGTGSTGPGQAAVSVGTSGALRVCTSGPVPTGNGCIFCYNLAPRRWVAGGAISNGTLVLNWLSDLFGAPHEELLQAATEVPPGAEGLTVLPYLAGERSPHWNPKARGVLFGLGLHHGRGHLVRAFMEGVCFALKDVHRNLPEQLRAIQEFRATGGFTRSRIWVQMLADVLGSRVALPSETEAGAMGAALLALAEDIGLETAMDCASRIRVAESFAPQPGPSRIYREGFERYRALYPALEPQFPGPG
ncbi:MAG: gluconokinase [Armatimonadetes bacterium]|nr:gluconokinase [Armatimonadota bacterium]